MSIIRAAAFTDQGASWQEKLGFSIERPENLRAWTEEAFRSADALLFIGATGIAVRAIAPYLQGKMNDPAVLVMDEMGKHVVSLLSGHWGGANTLALTLAEKIGADPVITTASDVRGLPAIDVWSREECCAIENPSAIKVISSAVLAGRPVGVQITERNIKPPFPVTLILRPRTLCLGCGCRKGLNADVFEETVTRFLTVNGVSLLSLSCLATIDRKAQEPAFLRFCEKYQLRLLCYAANTLAAVPGVFAHSERVLAEVGVDNVCERAAFLACGQKRLLVGKTIFQGMTLALAGEEQT